MQAELTDGVLSLGSVAVLERVSERVEHVARRGVTATLGELDLEQAAQAGVVTGIDHALHGRQLPIVERGEVVLPFTISPETTAFFVNAYARDGLDIVTSELRSAEQTYRLPSILYNTLWPIVALPVSSATGVHAPVSLSTRYSRPVASVRFSKRLPAWKSTGWRAGIMLTGG